MREASSIPQEQHDTTSAPARRTRKPRTARKAAPASFVGQAPATTIPGKDPERLGRVDILDFEPAAGPARVGLGEPFAVRARVIMEPGRTARATAVLKTSRGRVMARVPMTASTDGTGMWTAMLQAGIPSDVAPWQDGFAEVAKQLGTWKVSIEGWQDSYADWFNGASRAVAAGTSAEHALAMGAELFTRWAASRDAGLDADAKRMLRETAKALTDASIAPADRLAIAHTDQVIALHDTNPLRDGLTAGADHLFRVERATAGAAAWYQCSLRDASGLGDLTALLERAKGEGFGIVSLRDAGFATLDPRLGTMDDVTAACTRAHDLGLEVALDFALDCDPADPWAVEHAAWFTPGIDGTVSLDFDIDFDGLAHEVARILEQWADAGVTAFRIGHAEDAPARFWQDVIAMVTRKHPETVFMAQDVTGDPMLRVLGRAGFSQGSGTFPWRTTREELERALAQANGADAYDIHEVFCPATLGMPSGYLADNGTAGYAVRAVLAAMGSPAWGIPAGYELAATADDAGLDWSKADELGIAELVTSLNRVRAGHAAMRSYHDLTVLPSANPAVVAFARFVPAELTGTGKPDMLIVVVNLDCYHEQQSQIHVELGDFGLPTDGTYKVHDELTGREFDWSWDNYVALAPWADVAHILSVEF